MPPATMCREIGRIAGISRMCGLHRFSEAYLCAGVPSEQ